MRKSALIHGLVFFVITICLTYIMVPSFEAVAAEGECPSVIEKEGTTLNVHYFYTTSCFYCTLEAPILKRAVKDHNITLYSYNLDFCPEEAAQFGVGGVPTFIFENKEEQKKIASFLPKSALRSIICVMGGGCL